MEHPNDPIFQRLSPHGVIILWQLGSRGEELPVPLRVRPGTAQHSMVQTSGEMNPDSRVICPVGRSGKELVGSLTHHTAHLITLFCFLYYTKLLYFVFSFFFCFKIRRMNRLIGHWLMYSLSQVAEYLNLTRMCP